jgi:MFS family permease
VGAGDLARPSPAPYHGAVSSWRPTTRPSISDLAARFATTPFTRLARTHALSVAGDTLVALALAGSLFFSIRPDAARGKVALYLVLTMAPFAIVGPFIGPAIDRMAGGRRLMMLISALARLLASVLMIFNIDTVLLFPLAFVQLVSSKSYSVAKSALVPTTVEGDVELVEANSKLNLLSGVVGFVVGLLALPLVALEQPEIVVTLAGLAFAATTVAAWQLPRAQVAPAPMGGGERAELHQAGVLLAASAMAVLRASVGFMTFAVAFWFRRTGAPTVWFGVVLAFSTIGTLAGSTLAPIVRRSAREETMLIMALSVLAGSAGGAAVTGGRVSTAVLAGVIGFSANFGRLAFDSIVQRDAPAVNRGQSFAAFETKFQIVWVAAAFVPVVIEFPGWLAFLTISVAAGFAMVTYVLGLRQVRRHGTMPTPVRVRAARVARNVAAKRAGRPNAMLRSLPPPRSTEPVEPTESAGHPSTSPPSTSAPPSTQAMSPPLPTAPPPPPTHEN